MKISINAIAAMMLAMTSMPMYAATDKEMEEARTYAAQAYLRYANDGSGYLDELSVKSMSELKGKLKAQELENLKSFESVAVPKDYASWDKARLTEYWSKTFFASPGLLEKGRNSGAMARVRKKIGAMTVSATASAETTASEKAEATPADAGVDPLAGLETDPNEAAAAASLPDSIEATAKKLEEAMLEEEHSASARGNNYTWVYVVILAVLIGVVIWLVIFASRVMKRSDERRSEYREDGDRKEGSEADTGEMEARLRKVDKESAAMRERFAATLAGKNDEVREIRRGADILRAENDGLKTELGKVKEMAARYKEEAQQYKEECNRLFEENKELHEKLAGGAMAAATVAPVSASAAPAAPAPAIPRVASPAPATPRAAAPVQEQAKAAQVRTIYLGRANGRGLFVRADRKLNAGHTVYRLDTTDGYAGTFRVAADPEVWETALDHPMEMLAGASIAADMADTAGKTRIVTESPGTAIFEEGCWKVIRKARIRFE